MTTEVLGVAAVLDSVAVTLNELAERVAARFAESVPAADDIDDLDPSLVDALGADPGARAGIGFVFAPGAVRGRTRMLHWYWQTDSQPPARLRANVDPNEPEFYDYTMAGWYRQPYTRSKANLTGPYVDYICSNEYVFTMAVPILVGDFFVGLAAADLRAAQIERALTEHLALADSPLVIANDEGRIIASNVGGAVPGAKIGAVRLPLAAAERMGATAELVLPWRAYRPA